MTPANRHFLEGVGLLLVLIVALVAVEGALAFLFFNPN